MLTSPAEVVRRVRGRITGRLHSLPILVLHAHTACNCRCVMCDIWKANAARRSIGAAELERHLADIVALDVRRVMLTGGEPLLHENLWALCDRLREHGIRVTLVTTGLLVEAHAEAIARTIDQLVVSIDGPPAVHDKVRGVSAGFERIARGLRALAGQPRRPATIVRCVVQKANHGCIAETIEAVADIGADELSFLAADVSSQAFNRPVPWDETRRASVALSQDEVRALADAIHAAERRCARSFERRFVTGGAAWLWRIHDYYRALAGDGPLPPVRCRAPWVSAVLEPGGVLRPCFFHAAYPEGGLRQSLNAPEAIAFRRGLDITRDETCRRCVCALNLPFWLEP